MIHESSCNILKMLDNVCISGIVQEFDVSEEVLNTLLFLFYIKDIIQIL